jgi:hypothetical protein
MLNLLTYCNLNVKFFLLDGARHGISRDDATREMCNVWKSDSRIAAIVLNEKIGKFVADVMCWNSVRIAQDDLIWKPPIPLDIDSTSSRKSPSGKITVGFHQDSAYISTQFEPYENNSVTVWFALEDTDEENGCMEYAEGSHLWRPITNSPDFNEKVVGQDDPSLDSFHMCDETTYRQSMSTAASLANIKDPVSTIMKMPCSEGHAIFHHQDIWHGSGPNVSTMRHRRTLVAHYLRGDVSFREEKGPTRKYTLFLTRFV